MAHDRRERILMQVVREALPPYISKETAESILFIGKAMRVLKQSARQQTGASGTLVYTHVHHPLACTSITVSAVHHCHTAYSA